MGTAWLKRLFRKRKKTEETFATHVRVICAEQIAQMVQRGGRPCLDCPLWYLKDRAAKEER